MNDFKTLDEVIAEFQRRKAFIQCYTKNGVEYETDALHYLKVLREVMELTDSPNEELNVPMTWEELRRMQDKPVYWVHGDVGEWLTIYRVPTLGNGNDDVIYATTCSGVECWIFRKHLDEYRYFRREVD